MDAYYSQLRLIHITAVCLSGGLFFLRGLLLNVLSRPWAMAAPVRYASYAIDTVLLTAAIMLTTIVRQYPGLDAWLSVKVALLVVYIGLGTFALKRGRTARARTVSWIAAMAVFGFMVTVARTHHPLGALSVVLD